MKFGTNGFTDLWDKKELLQNEKETLPLWTKTTAIGEKQYMFPSFLLNC